MDVRMFHDPDAVAVFVAELVAKVVRDKPEVVLGLPTGHTPVPVYERLSEMELDFAAVRVVMLDEYVGLSGDDHRSYRHFIHGHVIEPLGVPAAQLYTLDGSAVDLDAECRRFDDLVSGMGIDLQLLGVGRDGHIGFNEPGSAHDSRTRVVDLAPVTRSDNADGFGSMEAVPKQAVTQGIGTILAANRIVLIATGPAKADAVAATVQGPISDEVPASALRRHRAATIVADRDAGALLEL